MNQNVFGSWRLAIVVATMVGLCASPVRSEILSRAAALRLLQESGNRWRQAETVIDEARAKTWLAWGTVLPHLDLKSRQYLSQVNPLRYGLPENLGGFISAGGTHIEAVGALVDVANWIRIHAAKLNEGAAELQKRQLQNDLQFAALMQYALAQRQKSKIQAVAASLERSEGLRKIAQMRLSTGVGVKLDLMRAGALVSLDRLKLLEAQNNYQKALRDLAVILGADDLSADLPPLELRPIEPELIQRFKNQDPTSRAEVIAARAQSLAATKLAAASNWNLVPRLRLFSEVGYFGSASVLGLGNGSLAGTVAVEISLPLFHGGVEIARATQDRVQSLRAELQANQIALETRSQHAYLVGQLDVVQQATLTAQEHVRSVQEESRLIQMRFEAGSASGMEVTNSHVALAAAMDQEIESIYSVEAARFSLLRALGDFEGIQ